jgi:importin subunit beta-1
VALQIMTILWGHLVNSKVHRNVKPQILSVFGDIALQIGDRFEPYMADTFQVRFQLIVLFVSVAIWWWCVGMCVGVCL